MTMPRDDNLRLIGAEEEARHIQERYREARNTTVFFLLFVVNGIVSTIFVPSGVGWIEASPVVQGYFVISGFIVPFAVFFVVFYGVRTLRYIWFRYRHRAFLRKYDRPYPTI
jgi:hypothetical protein